MKKICFVTWFYKLILQVLFFFWAEHSKQESTDPSRQTEPVPWSLHQMAGSYGA